MQSALIIGAGGQDGRLLTDLLQQRGYAVHGWTREDSVDLLDAKSIAHELDRLQPNEIYYLAAFHHASEDAVEISEEELLRRSRAVHVDGLRNVLSALRKSSSEARLFYAASSHVFGANQDAQQNESRPFAPNSAYAISKAEGIECCREFRTEGVFAATGILYNHESALRKASFLSQKIVQGALQAQRDSSHKLVLGDLDARVDWGYAPDYIEAMSHVLRLPEADDFVIASGETHSVREFAEIAFAAVGLDWKNHIETDASLLRKESHPLCGDASKLRASTGWSSTLNFKQMVRALVDEAICARPKFSAPLPSGSELAGVFA